jgi:ribonuclease HI
VETTLQIFTDGGCSGNPGPGGWAYIIVIKTSDGEQLVSEEKGSEKNTTNNRMELMAVISSLKALKTMADLPRQAVVYTDSQYVQKGISEWINKWKINSWRTSDKKPVKNQDLWMELDALAGEFSLSWEWVKGHAGNFFNERCDSMTQDAIMSVNTKAEPLLFRFC